MRNRSILPLFSGSINPKNINGFYAGLFSENINKIDTYTMNYWKLESINQSINESQYNPVISGSVENLGLFNGNFVPKNPTTNPVSNNMAIVSYAPFGEFLNTYTFFSVFDSINSSTNTFYVSLNLLSTAGVKLVEIIKNSSGNIEVTIRDRFNTSQINVITLIPANQNNIICLKFDVNLKKLDVYVNGINYNATNPSLATHWFNSSGVNGANYWLSDGTSLNNTYGVMGDSYIYNTLLTNNEINQVGNFLKEKFGGNWTNI